MWIFFLMIYGHILLHISKAINKIWHATVLNKLRSYGFSWLSAFLEWLITVSVPIPMVNSNFHYVNKVSPKGVIYIHLNHRLISNSLSQNLETILDCGDSHFIIGSILTLEYCFSLKYYSSTYLVLDESSLLAERCIQLYCTNFLKRTQMKQTHFSLPFHLPKNLALWISRMFIFLKLDHLSFIEKQFDLIITLFSQQNCPLMTQLCSWDITFVHIWTSSFMFGRTYRHYYIYETNEEVKEFIVLQS